MAYPDGILQALRELSQLMVDEERLDETLERVVTLTCLSLSGCDLASISVEGSGTRTAACTDPVAGEIDQAQYAAGDGPCLHACRAAAVVEIQSIADDERWPDFREAALQRGVQSALVLPLVHRGEGRGAFNLYAREIDAFSADDLHHATLFAEQAAVAVANSEVYWRTHELTQNLQAALEHRDVIGQAKGIVMARTGCTADEAFEVLRRASQRGNVKLREVADRVALTGEPPADG